jgi:hypothetical protein
VNVGILQDFQRWGEGWKTRVMFSRLSTTWHLHSALLGRLTSSLFFVPSYFDLFFFFSMVRRNR